MDSQCSMMGSHDPAGYKMTKTDKQRDRGVVDKSIRALQILNRLGYGMPPLALDLVYNALDPSLPPPQDRLEADYKEQLRDRFGIEFNHLSITFPTSASPDFLQLSRRFAAHMGLLVNHFNPRAVSNLMCRSLVSVGWDGKLYDCDFNQMLELSMSRVPGTLGLTIWNLDSFSALSGQRIATGGHCFGCTAGAGSSCGGTLA